MATAEIAASWSGYIRSGSTGTYATARSTSTVGPTAGSAYVGQTTAYRVYRGYLKFDTSSLSGLAITQVNLRMMLGNDSSTDDFDVQIVKYDWSAIDPLDSGSRETAFDGCLAAAADDNIWRNTAGVSTNVQYTSGNLSTAWINTSGSTYYGLRSAEDYNNSAPTNSELVVPYGYSESDPNRKPVLIVTYTEGGGGSSTPIHLIRTGMQPGMRIGL